MKKRILAICGGIGGAKLAFGLSKVLPPEELVFLVNTGDDFTYLNLNISRILKQIDLGRCCFCIYWLSVNG